MSEKLKPVLAAVIDSETLSIQRDKLIFSIGIVFGDLATREVKDTFYVEIDVEEQLKKYSVDPSTMAFWLEQKDQARQQLIRILKRGGFPRDIAMQQVCNFLKALPNGTRVVGNGPLFDLGPIADFTGHDNFPWAFWAERNVRDWLDLCELTTGIRVRDKVQFAGVPHNALDDARHEFLLMAEVLDIMRALTAPTVHLDLAVDEVKPEDAEAMRQAIESMRSASAAMVNTAWCGPHGHLLRSGPDTAKSLAYTLDTTIARGEPWSAEAMRQAMPEASTNGVAESSVVVVNNCVQGPGFTTEVDVKANPVSGEVVGFKHLDYKPFDADGFTNRSGQEYASELAGFFDDIHDFVLAGYIRDIIDAHTGYSPLQLVVWEERPIYYTNGRSTGQLQEYAVSTTGPKGETILRLMAPSHDQAVKWLNDKFDLTEEYDSKLLVTALPSPLDLDLTVDDEPEMPDTIEAVRDAVQELVDTGGRDALRDIARLFAEAKEYPADTNEIPILDAVGPEDEYELWPVAHSLSPTPAFYVAADDRMAAEAALADQFDMSAGEIFDEYGLSLAGRPVEICTSDAVQVQTEAYEEVQPEQGVGCQSAQAELVGAPTREELMETRNKSALFDLVQAALHGEGYPADGLLVPPCPPAVKYSGKGKWTLEVKQSDEITKTVVWVKASNKMAAGAHICEWFDVSPAELMRLNLFIAPEDEDL